MGLKGYRLWAMCQLDSNVQSPHRVEQIPLDAELEQVVVHGRLGHLLVHLHAVALQVAFERQTLKPVFLVDRL
jgi:hypothetical protein